MKIPTKKFNKKVKDYTKGAVTLGIGTAIGAGATSKLPAAQGASIMSGFSTAASFSGVAATATFGGAAIDAVKGLQPKKKKKKR